MGHHRFYTHTSSFRFKALKGLFRHFDAVVGRLFSKAGVEAAQEQQRILGRDLFVVVVKDFLVDVGDPVSRQKVEAFGTTNSVRS